MNTTTKDTVIGVWPTLIYRDGQAALKFLTEGLGFTLVASYPGRRRRVDRPFRAGLAGRWRA